MRNNDIIGIADLFPKEKRNLQAIIFDTGKQILIDVPTIIGILMLLNFEALKHDGIYMIFGAYFVHFLITFAIERFFLRVLRGGNTPISLKDISETTKYNHYSRWCSINGFLVFFLMVIVYSAFARS